jgi:CelD/BcsL family acetyltransferase involved in cellulose biosynthesis
MQRIELKTGEQHGQQTLNLVTVLASMPKEEPVHETLAQFQRADMAIIVEDKLSASHDSGKWQYKVYSDLSAIAGLSCQWDNLLAASSGNKAFGSLEWYLASCRVQNSLSPYLVIGALGPEITCILPLALNPQNGTAVFPHFANDYNDILVRDGNLVQAADLLKFALSSQTGCSRIILSKLRPDSACARLSGCLTGIPDIECHYRETEIYSYIQLPATFAEYLQSRSKPFRRDIKRALRKTDAHGLTYRELLPDEFDPFFLPEVFLRLILDRQDEKCLFRLAHAQSFVREVLPLLFRKRHMLVFAMFQEKQIVAIDLYFVAGNGLTAWSGAFLSEIERWSPGTALIAFGIQQAISLRIREFDFGDGNEAYKKHWVSNEYAIGTMELIPELSM